MGDYRVIGGVSNTLKSLLEDRLHDETATVTLSGLAENGNSDRRVNLYLYRVTENAYLKNQEIPGQGHPGAYGHPPLSLDLDYLMTTYGSGTSEDLAPQELMGDAMSILHDFAIITPSLLRQIDPGDAILDPTLVGEFERIKIALQPMSLDDLSKIWSSFANTGFTRSVAYRVSVVQIESTRPRRFPKPVGEPPAEGPRVHAPPIGSPRITGLGVRRIAIPGDAPGAESTTAYIRIGDMIVIHGTSLGARNTRLHVGGISIPGEGFSILGSGQIQAVVPDDKELLPGAQIVRVSQDVMLGDPPERRTGFDSNRAVVMLIPRVNGAAWRTDPPLGLKIEGQRLYDDGLSGEALLGASVVPKSDYGPETEESALHISLLDSWPAWPVACLVSGALDALISLNPGEHKLKVTIGSEERTATFTVPTGTQPEDPVDVTLAELSDLLETAIRASSQSGAFQTILAFRSDNQIHVLSSGTGHAVTFADESEDTTASLLALTVEASSARAHISGDLSTFPTLSDPDPRLSLTVGETSLDISIGSAASATTSSVAGDLQSAIDNASVPHASALAHRDRILVVVPADTPVVFDVAEADDPTVYELRLRAHFPIRVRVNGAESIDDLEANIP